MSKISAWISNNEHLVLYSLLFVFTAFPLLQPMGLPISVSDATSKFISIVNSDLEEGDIVYFDMAFGPGSWTECGPQSVISLKHLWDKGVKVLFLSFVADGPQMYNVIISQAPPPSDYEYGIDWVHLGYLSGGETACAAIAQDTWSIVKTDDFGTPLEDLQLMHEVRSAEDAEMLFLASSGQPQTWVRQWYEPYGKKIMLLPMSINIPAEMAYIESGQIAAYIPGGRGAAEYEVALNKPGEASTLTDAMSLQHIYLICLIVIGNVLFLREKSQRTPIESRETT